MHLTGHLHWRGGGGGQAGDSGDLPSVSLLMMALSTLAQVPAVGQCEHPPVPRPEQLPRLQVRVDRVQLPAGPVVNQHSSAHPLASSLAGSLAQEWDQKQQQKEHLQNIMSCNGHDGSHVTNISSRVSWSMCHVSQWQHVTAVLPDVSHTRLHHIWLWSGRY